MAGSIRIKDLPESTSFEDGQFIPIDNTDGTKKISKTNLLNSLPVASTGEKGLMSSEDKRKLDSLSTDIPGLDLSIFIIGEPLNGLQDGINCDFYIEDKVFPNSERIYIGPARLFRGSGYTVAYTTVRTTIRFTIAPGEKDILSYDAIRG